MMQKVEISLRIPGTLPIPELMPLTNDVEDAGFYGAGILNSQWLCRDVFVTMGAADMQSVEELASGRIKCIIDTGSTSASTIGRKPGTLAQMRSTIQTIKALLNEQSVDSKAPLAGSASRQNAASQC
jgi:hypothetical protein